jgi:hypothetical protein
MNEDIPLPSSLPTAAPKYPPCRVSRLQAVNDCPHAGASHLGKSGMTRLRRRHRLIRPTVRITIPVDIMRRVSIPRRARIIRRAATIRRAITRQRARTTQCIRAAPTMAAAGRAALTIPARAILMVAGRAARHTDNSCAGTAPSAAEISSARSPERLSATFMVILVETANRLALDVAGGPRG